MRYTTFNTDKFDFTEEYMFFGKPVSTSRFDIQKFGVFEKLIEKQLSFFWRPEEVALSQDRKDFKTLSDSEKHIFLSNLKYQTVLDSVASRSPNVALLKLISLPEFETWTETWAFSETIHSRSYTHIMRNVLNDPAVVFDDIVLDEKIIERSKSVCAEYDKLIEMGDQWNLYPHSVDMDKLREQLYRTIVAINILEGVRFFVSFACSFAFAERKLMEGNAKIIKLIARDEHLHLAGTQRILNMWANGEDDPKMKEVADKFRAKGWVYDMFQQAVEEEKNWANYLFKDGSMIGLNSDILNQYIEYVANFRLNSLGYESIYMQNENPLPWIDAWFTNDSVQPAPQEGEIVSYLTGQVESDMEVEDFNDFKLD